MARVPTYSGYRAFNDFTPLGLLQFVKIRLQQQVKWSIFV